MAIAAESSRFTAANEVTGEHDVSELAGLAALAAELDRVEAELDSEREARARAENAVRSAREALAMEVRAREEALAVAAHDLKTPLAVLSLQIHRTLRKEVPLDPERLTAYLSSMARQTRHMTALVDRLLDASQISVGNLELHLETFDLAELVHEVGERLAPDIELSGCRLTINAEAPVIGLWDRMRLDQVVTNLISNALKYGSGKPVDVLVQSEGGIARFAVRDRGIGIAAKDHERVFEKFERAEVSGLEPGVGLGLWIVRSIVHALGGRIGLSSARGYGSTFTVFLPKRPLSLP
jgi:signal transduction histidine kinase